jgi:sec-independent protein translocase protein TatB
MFGIGMSEMIIICVVALLVFGPDELPQVVKKIARGIGEARKVTDDLRRSIDFVDDDEEDRRARSFARSQQSSQLASQQSAQVSTPAVGALAEPEVIPGSALTPAHADDAPVIAAPVGAIAVGADDDDADGDSVSDANVTPAGTTAPPTTPTTTPTTTQDGSHGADALGGEPPPVAGR